MSQSFEPTPGYHIFLAQLVKARTDLGISQEELAHRLGLPVELIASFESGEIHLDFVRTRYWCEALGISFTNFVLAVEAAMNAESRPLVSDDSDNTNTKESE